MSGKNTLRDGLNAPMGNPGSIRTFQPITEQDHSALREFSRHQAAENPVQREVKGRGYVVVFENKRKRRNHWLDTSYYAMVALSFAGANFSGEEQEG